MRKQLTGHTGMKIRAGDGCEQLGFPEMLSTPMFYLASPGDRLSLIDDAYKFNVATYRPEVDPRWIYTYDYAPDQSWTVYNNDLSGSSYRQEDYVFTKQVYFRACLRKVSGGVFDGTENINEILVFETSAPDKQSSACSKKPWLTGEVKRVSARIEESQKAGSTAFILMADSHYNVNGTWDDTKAAINLLCGSIAIDGIIHLGDFTDGMVTADVTRYYVKTILDDIKNCGVPVYVTLGNHDCNYFRGNPERLTAGQQREIYLSGRDVHYYIDYQNLRLIFPDSFDPAEAQRYGYTSECIKWLEQTLESTPSGSSVLIFSHMPPVARLQYWTDCLRGEAEIISIAGRHKDRILAWVNGHNHADRLDNAEGFPVVSIGCAKCEAYLERKPESFITPERRLGEVSQELFDILIVDAQERKARLVRFGAGQDRFVADGEARWAGSI